MYIRATIFFYCFNWHMHDNFITKIDSDREYLVTFDTKIVWLGLLFVKMMPRNL